MIDIYTEHHPHQHPVIPIEHLKMVGAQYYTSLLSKLTSHINNDDVHVTNKDKVEWEKAFLDIKDLKDKVDNLEPSSSSKDENNYATKDYVDGQLSGYATVGALNNYVSFDDLNSRNYATEAWVLKQIKDIDPHIDLDGYVTDEELAAAIVNLATKSDIMQLSNKDNLLDMRINDLQDQIDGIEKYELPVATNTVLGGFKAGYQSSGNNYAVKMDGEYAYVSIPFSTTGGDDIEVTETYNIIIVGDTVTKEYVEGGDIISGYIQWQVSKTMGSVVSYVIPGQEISTYAVALPSNGRLIGSFDELTSAYKSTINSTNSGDIYVKIVVEKNGSIVCSQVIPIQAPGKNGEIEYQSLAYAVIRLKGEFNPEEPYNGGDEYEDGVQYIDVVSCNGALYKAKKGNKILRNEPTGTDTDPYWEPFSVYGGNAFHNLLIAEQAYITALASKQVVVVDDSSKPVAGLLSNDTTVKTDSGIYTRSGIRIFAGATGGDIASAPFRVYDDGRLVANNAQIKGYINATDGVFSGKVIINNTSIVLNTDGSGQVANGNIWWDANGNITINGATIINSKIVADPDKKDYQDLSDTINVTFASTPTYNKSNGVVSNIRLRVVNDTQFQGQVKIQVGFDGVHGDWSAQSETGWFQVAERTTKVIDVPDAIANGNISADMDSNSPVVTSVIGVEDSNV